MGLFNNMLVGAMPFVPKPIVGFFAKKYVAGTCLDDAVKTVKDLNAHGVCATMDLLGESTTDREEARNAVAVYKQMLAAIEDLKLDSNISVKPTHMGLNIDYGFCFENIRELVEEADRRGNFVRIDMEDSPTHDDTFKILTELRKKYDNVGAVLQAYMRRAMDDINKVLAPLKANVRLCKGIYIEKHEIAYRDYETVRNNYGYLLEKLLSEGCYTGIATHDEMLVWKGMSVVDRLRLDKDRYEFQMLLGVTPALRDIVVKAGHRMRVYVPFGEDWHPYCVRRMKENPEVAGYVMKAFLSGGK
ncbi:MAG: proline dehydrogenase family protein [Chloroflexi bacterium]|nr:proline dehydrogenase family protein [Chloroflexota bacterium]